MCRLSSLLIAVLLVAASCKDSEKARRQTPTATKQHSPLRIVKLRPPSQHENEVTQFRPLPTYYTKTGQAPSAELSELGRTLFFDERFSKNHDISCNSCHPLAAYGVDGLRVSVGHRRQTGDRNAPTVYNAAGQRSQFWDGRERTVENQAKRPVLDSREMAMPSEQRVVETIRSIPGYVKMFAAAFPGAEESISYDNFAAAIGAFERTLVTPAPWDSYLKQVLASRRPAPAGSGGSAQTEPPEEQPAPVTMTPEQHRGFLLFYQVGCPSCHDGSLVGGSLFERLGKVRAWPNEKDTGRGRVTGRKDQHMVFKVASLRNVEKTAPYFHDASSAELPDAVKRMAKHQLGVALSDAQASDITAWLEMLTGPIPAELSRMPTLPKSSAETPKPDPT